MCLYPQSLLPEPKCGRPGRNEGSAGRSAHTFPPAPGWLQRQRARWARSRGGGTSHEQGRRLKQNGLRPRPWQEGSVVCSTARGRWSRKGQEGLEPMCARQSSPRRRPFVCLSKFACLLTQFLLPFPPSAILSTHPLIHPTIHPSISVWRAPTHPSSPPPPLPTHPPLHALTAHPHLFTLPPQACACLHSFHKQLAAASCVSCRKDKKIKRPR